MNFDRDTISPSARSVRRRGGVDAASLSLNSLLGGEQILLRIDAVDIRAMSEMPGTCTLSNYQLSFASTDEPGYEQVFYRIPCATIGSLKLDKSNRVIGRAKDCRDFALEPTTPEDARRLFDALCEQVYCDHSDRFAFVHRPVFHPMSTTPSIPPTPSGGAGAGGGAAAGATATATQNGTHTATDAKKAGSSPPQPPATTATASSSQQSQSHSQSVVAAGMTPTQLPPSLMIEDGWNVYDEREEWNRMGLVGEGLRECTVNTGFTVCESYPQRVVVPACITDDDVRASAAFRKLARFPTITWKHQHTNSILFRSSQPLVGVASSHSNEDERLVAEVAALTGGRLIIYDGRKSRSALWHKLGGAGTENSRYKLASPVQFCDVGNVHVVRESYFEFLEVCRPLAKKTLRNLRRLEGVRQARWFVEMGKLLTSALSIARELDRAPTTLLVHCSDGLNRTTQLVSLAQVLLDPYYRTTRGFVVLLEKEWCSFGHRFAERHDLGARAHPTAKFAPVFLQFLDRVWQLLQVAPSAFEFTEKFLICISDSVFNARHGTFLHNSAKEAFATRARETSPSLWTEVFAARANFEHANFKPVEGMLLTQIEPGSLQLWESYYLRYMGDDWVYRERYAEQLVLPESTSGQSAIMIPGGGGGARRTPKGGGNASNKVAGDSESDGGSSSVVVE